MKIKALYLILFGLFFIVVSCWPGYRIQHSSSIHKKKNVLSVSVYEDTLVQKLFNMDLKDKIVVELYKINKEKQKQGLSKIFFSNGFVLCGKYLNGKMAYSWKLIDNYGEEIGIIRFNTEGKILMVLAKKNNQMIPILISQ